MTTEKVIIVPHVTIAWEVLVGDDEDGPEFTQLAEALAFRDDVITYGSEFAFDKRKTDPWNG